MMTGLLVEEITTTTVLDLYAFNEDDDEVANTTSTTDDQRDEDDCDGDSYCVNLLLSSYMMTDTTNGDGEWTF